MKAILKDSAKKVMKGNIFKPTSSNNNKPSQVNVVVPSNNQNVSPEKPSQVLIAKNFIEYIKLILDRIGLKSDNANYDSVLAKFSSLDEKKQNIIIESEELRNKISTLLDYDGAFRTIGENMISKLSDQQTRDKWDSVMGRLAELQGLVILKKIDNEDTQQIISSLLDALDNKIKIINTILNDDKTETNQPVENQPTNAQIGGAINNVEKSINYLINKNNYLNFLKNNIY